MKTRVLLLIVSLVGSAMVGWAQQPDQRTKTFASSAEVQALVANAKRIRTANQALVSQPIVQLAPYRASLEYRAIPGSAAIHEKEAEIFYVIDGAGTLVTGGKLVGEKRTNADNLAGAAIEGGTAQHLSKGDFVIVPENIPHWFSEVNEALVLMSMHVPRAVSKNQ